MMLLTRRRAASLLALPLAAPSLAREAGRGPE